MGVLDREISWVTDAMCSWCWGFAPVMARDPRMGPAEMIVQAVERWIQDRVAGEGAACVVDGTC